MISKLNIRVEMSYSIQYICLLASSKCNMKCKYCFIQDKPDVNITIDEAKCFIDCYIRVLRSIEVHCGFAG